MVYYPLQLLQLAGHPRGARRHRQGACRSDDRPARRRASHPFAEATRRCSSSISPTRCRRGPAGSPRWSGWPRTSPRGEPLVVVLGDNIFEYSHAAEIAAWGASRRRCPGLRQGRARPRELRRRRLRRRRARSSTSPRRRGSSTSATRRRRRTTPSSGLYCYPPDVFAVIASLERSSRGELEITDVNRAYAERGALVGRSGARLVGGRRQALAAPRRDRPHDRRDGRQQVTVDGDHPDPAAAVRGRARLVLRAATRERPAEADRADERLVLAPRRHPRPPLSRARAGRPLRLPAGNGTRRRPRPRRRGATFTEDIGDENPVALYIPGRHAHGFEALTDLLFVYHVTEEYDPADPGRARHPLGRPSRQGSVEHADTRSSPPGPEAE